MPTLTMPRDSGAIEQDADTVLMRHRPDYYQGNRDPSHVSTYKLVVGIQK